MTDEIGSDNFTPQNELELELVRAAHEPGLRDAFLRELIGAEIYLALLPASGKIQVGANGQAIVPPDVRLEIGPVQQGGKTLLPIFSAPIRAQAQYQADHFIATDKLRDLFVRHPGTEFVLNPGSDYGLLLLRSDIEAMLRGDLTAH
jgi:hypothetical protein